MTCGSGDKPSLLSRTFEETCIISYKLSLLSTKLKYRVKYRDSSLKRRVCKERNEKRENKRYLLSVFTSRKLIIALFLLGKSLIGIDTFFSNNFSLICSRCNSRNNIHAISTDFISKMKNQQNEVGSTGDFKIPGPSTKS